MAADEDLISGLPDEILNKILMGLPTEEAARSRMLARRWRNLWYVGPKLEINLLEITEGGKDFVAKVLSFIDFSLRFLSLRQPPFHLLPLTRNPFFEKFTLQCEPYHFDSVAPYLENWIVRLFKLGVKDLDLLISFDYPNSMLLSTWAAMYPCENLVSLKIEGFFFEIPHWLPNLETLDVYVMTGAVKRDEGGGLSIMAATNSFSQFPKLKTLKVRAGVPSDLNIILPSLRNLELRLNHFNANKVLIDAPMLKELKISQEHGSDGGDYSVRASSSLEKASFEIMHPRKDEPEIKYDIIELPSAMNITKAWLKEHQQLECLEFISCHSVFQIELDTQLELVLSLCQEQQLHDLSATVKDLQVLKVGIDNSEEDNSEDDNSEAEDSEDSEEEDFEEENKDDFLRMKGKQDFFVADRMWVEVACQKSHCS